VRSCPPELEVLVTLLLSARTARRPSAVARSLALVTAAAATAVALIAMSALGIVVAPAHADETASTYFLDAGQSLTAGQSLDDAFDQYRLTVQSDGNVVEYGNGRALWSLGTSGVGNVLTLQNDGNLVVRSATGKALWSAGSKGSDATLIIGIGGDVEIATKTTGIYDHVLTSSLSGTAVAGDVMTAGQSLYGYTATLFLQSDGNLVDNVQGHVIWQSKTSGNAGATLHVQKDGNVVIYSKSGKALWSTHTSGSGVGFSVSVHGELTVTRAGTLLWHAA
jgi:pseudomonalisin